LRPPVTMAEEEEEPREPGVDTAEESRYFSCADAALLYCMSWREHKADVQPHLSRPSWNVKQPPATFSRGVPRHCSMCNKLTTSHCPCGMPYCSNGCRDEDNDHKWICGAYRVDGDYFWFSEDPEELADELRKREKEKRDKQKRRSPPKKKARTAVAR